MAEQEDDKAVINIREESVGDSEEEITARFNPTEYSHEKSITYADQEMPGFSSPVTQFAGGEAENSDPILLFDEADALFGKRPESSDTRDRYANIEVNYLLQCAEEHDGAVIPTTNFEWNIDDAFLRRIVLSVDSQCPDEKAREMIWRRIFPMEEIPRGRLDPEFELTGGNIKNVALAAAFLPAGPRDDEKETTYCAEHETIRKLTEEITKNGESGLVFLDFIRMKHETRGAWWGLQKNRRFVKTEDSGEYGEMVS